MVFIETPLFTSIIVGLLTDDAYGEFQQELAANPDAGNVIKGTGGLRKVRTAAKGKGKRGGARVIYYYFADKSQIVLLLAYPKGVKDDLSAKEKAILAKIIKDWS